jgi:hypothetical protein
MTVRSANNAIGTILKVEVFSGRTADLHMFLGPCCKLLLVKVAIVGLTSVWLCYDVTVIRRQRHSSKHRHNYTLKAVLRVGLCFSLID